MGIAALQKPIGAGFKQTEAGVIPADWKSGSLGDETRKIGSGITPTGGQRVYKKEGHPFLRSQNIGWGKILMQDIAYIDDATHESFKGTEIESGDVFLNITGASIGRSAVADARVVGGNVNQHVCIIRTKHEQIYSRFLSYFLLSTAGQRQIDSFQAGGNRQGLNFGQIKSFQLPLPPLPEQTAIASVLSDVDALIACLDELIAKKRDIKQAAMQQLLTGKQRLPGFTGQWDQTTLGEIGECVIGLTYKPENVVQYGLLVLRSSNVQNGHLAFEDNVYVNVAVREKLITREGDILICVRNGSRALIGKCALIDERGAGQTFGAFMSIYRTKYSQFIFHAFQSHDIQRQIRENIGATINQITNKDMKALQLKLPPEREQTAISAVLTDMDDSIAALEARRNKTRALKQGMMQQLLTGKIRLV